ncbi:MAG TPA: cytochrome b [Rhodospirillaceae bacterium]|nr:cytochrome b [Rhodospirillaceae bacterium]
MTTRYGTVAITLHWLTALAVAGLLVVGHVMTDLPNGASLKFVLYQWHKSVGITVLGLTLLRLAWRLVHRPPPLPDEVAWWERKASALAHLALYAFLLGMPLSGWALVSASPLNFPTILFGVLPWPHIPMLAALSDKEPVAALFKTGHDLAGNLLTALVLFHAAAALWHHLYRKDEILLRMLPRFIPLSRRGS